MSRVQLALRVSDLDASIAFYRSLFGVEPAKLRPGYANFAVTEPPLKLVLIEGEPGRPTVMDHLGVEVESTDEVHDATGRLSELGLFTLVEDDTTCCYARQDKVWVQGPGREPWEVYTVTEDSAVYGSDGAAGTMADPGDTSDAIDTGSLTSGGGSACCTDADAPAADTPAADQDVTLDEATPAAGCGCATSGVGTSSA